VSFRLIQGDCTEKMRELESGSVQCVVTSPPYWGLRDYGIEGQLGLESTPEQYVERMVEVFREVRRVLRDDGRVWLNLGDSYSADHNQGPRRNSGLSARTGPLTTRNVRPPGLKPKDLVGIPWRVAFALQADGWWLRSDIIWAKPNPMPESVTDRPTKAHEYVFLLTKAKTYYYDPDAVREPHAEFLSNGKPAPRARRGPRVEVQNIIFWENCDPGCERVVESGPSTIYPGGTQTWTTRDVTCIHGTMPYAAHIEAIYRIFWKSGGSTILRDDNSYNFGVTRQACADSG
jgi:hypothetical protein